VKLETFFEMFDQFADAPDSEAKMRELVLELAVRGALSERHASDQNESTWRELVAKIDQGPSNLNPDSQPPFEIPTAWRWSCLDDLGTTRVRNDIEDGERVSFVPMALISSTYGVAAQSEERRWSEIKKGFTHFAEGDVVMAKITPCFENAKSAVMRNLVNGVGAGTTELHVFRRRNNVVIPEFVLLYLKTHGFIARGEPRMTGSAGQKRVPRDYFATSPFPLPPLAEQKRIVAKVDQLMALCDRLALQQEERETRHAALARASLARFADAPTTANLRFLFHPAYVIPPADLRNSILTLAAQGKLVPQDLNGETAEDLLTAVRKAARESGCQRRPNSEDDENPKFCMHIPKELPKGWCTCPLEEVFRFIDYRGKTPVRSSSGVRLITAKNVKKGFVSNDPVEYIDEELYPKWMTRGFPKRGDLLFVTEGHTMGFVGMLDFDFEYALAQRTIVLQPFCDSFGPFYLYYLLSASFQSAVSVNATGSAAQGIKAAKLKRIRVVVPPVAEQRRIVAKVHDLMALVDELETRLAASRATAASMLSALVAELTAQACPMPNPSQSFDHESMLEDLPGAAKNAAAMRSSTTMSSKTSSSSANATSRKSPSQRPAAPFTSETKISTIRKPSVWIRRRNPAS
jgi:type I restriction enzyme S subunit